LADPVPAEPRWVQAGAIAAPTSVPRRRPSGLRGKKGGTNQEHKPRGPIKERSGGRIYAVDDLDDGASIDIDDIATSAKDDVEIDAPDAPGAPDDDNES
jgi:hypothetical protein